MTDKIQKAEIYARSTLLSAESVVRTSPEQAMYRFEHSLRVAALGQKIARSEGMDEEALVVSCLLHDLAYSVYDPALDWREHGRMSATLARPFVKTLDFPAKTETDILAGIALHVDLRAELPYEKTVFSQSVCDCDNMDRFDAHRIFDILLDFDFRKHTREDQLAFIGEKLRQAAEAEQFHMATPTAQALWADRLAFQREYFTRLKSQTALAPD